MKTDRDLTHRFFNSLDNSLKLYRHAIQGELVKNGIELTFDQYQVLDCIISGEDLKQSEIAAKISKDTASITRIIELMTKKGYLSRETDKDNRRRNVLGVTESGERVHSKAAIVVDEVTNSALAGIKLKQFKKLKKVFKVIAKNCG